MTYLLMIAVALMVPLQSFAQYHSGLYDIDSSADFGSGIRLNPGGTYLITGSSNTPAGYKINSVQLDRAGTGMQAKMIFGTPDVYYAQQSYGRMRATDSGYVIPISPFMFSADTVRRITARMGFMRFDTLGHVVRVSTYTDTMTESELAYDAAVCRNKDLLICGQHGPPPRYAIYEGLLVRTDSAGNLLWKRTYRRSSVNSCVINTVEELPDGRLLVCATSKNFTSRGQLNYYQTPPWVFITDSAGNILKEKIFPTKYGAGALPAVRIDANGAYYMYGALDSFVRPADPFDFKNFPFYIAHLDTNFNITWITNFAIDTGTYFSLASVRQLNDHHFLVVGNDIRRGLRYSEGWAAKVNSVNGNIIWSKAYTADTVNNQGLLDGVELSNGNIVLCGGAKNHNDPPWHNDDVWVLGIDRNGCAVPGCNQSTGIPYTPVINALKVYPNPTSGAITVEAIEEGTLYLTDVQGRQLAGYPVAAGKTVLQLSAISAGIYTGKLVGKQSGSISIVRIVYQP